MEIDLVKARSLLSKEVSEKLSDANLREIMFLYRTISRAVIMDRIRKGMEARKDATKKRR